MQEFVTLQERLSEAGRENSALRAVCPVVLALANAGVEIANMLALPPPGGECALRGVEKRTVARAQEIIVKALRGAPVASIASEALEGWAILDPEQPLAVVLDPLDSAPDIEANLSAGTVFAIVPAKGPNSPFIGRSIVQTVAGFLVYGAQTSLVLTLGHGVDIYTWDRRDETWRLTRTEAAVPVGAPEYAIDPAGYLHWEEPVRFYFENCLNEADGPRAKHFKMRWIGSLASEAFRILTRGGVYLCPADQRAVHLESQLRLVYQARPIAFIMEQAGGAASTGRARILDISPSNLNQRVPMIFGSAEKVAFIERLYAAPAGRSDVSPLFGRRGLFRT
jgi:fructose-1,6-bisphosphatase I